MAIGKNLMAVVVSGMMLGMTSMSHAASIFSSSFEDPTISPGFMYYPTNPFIEGWTITSGDVDIIRDAFSPTPFPDGHQAVDLNGDQNGSIAHDVTTVVGQSYALDFFLSQNGFSGPATTAVQATGGPVLVYGSDPSAWTGYEYDFTATSTTTSIQFSSLTPGGTSGPTLDFVTVSAVPIPASAGIGFSMLGGFGAMFAIRKRLNRTLRIAG